MQRNKASGFSQIAPMEAKFGTWRVSLVDLIGAIKAVYCLIVFFFEDSKKIAVLHKCQISIQNITKPV